MKFFKIVSELKRVDTALILYCLLDRIPIIVIGDDSNNIDELIIELSELTHFRKEFIFYTDFISTSEYDDLMLNENIDFNSQRSNIRCPCGVSLKALNQFEHFDSWILGIELPGTQDKRANIIKSITKKIKFFLGISLFSNSITIDIEGINWKSIDLTLEQNILQKISQDTEKAITKMRRVLLEKIKIGEFNNDLIKSLIDFEGEKEELKISIMKKEIQNFYSGSKRAFFIFTRLSLLSSIEFTTKIGSKTLFETIDYEEAPIERIVSFIKKEWGEDFTSLIDNGKKINALDSMQSLWG